MQLMLIFSIYATVIHWGSSMCYRFAKNYVGNEKSEVKGARKDNSREIIILQLHILGYTWCFSSSEVFHDCCHQVCLSDQIRSDQSLSRVRLFATPWITACQASLSITNSQSSLRLTSIESVMPSSHLILCRPLLLLPPIPPSIRVFSNESSLHMRWPKVLEFQLEHHSFQRNPRADLLQMAWLDLLAVQGTLKSLLQHF